MSLTPPPSPPLRSDPPADFIAKAEAYLSWQQTFVSEMKAAVEVANITLWVSGTTYAVGDVVWSPTNNKSYRRIIAGAGTTDPVSDAVNWSVIPYAASGANADITSASAMAPWTNGLINGGFEIWQRGAGGSASIAVPASTSAQYTADRWCLSTLANQACTVSQQAGLVDGSQYAGRIQRNSGQTGVGQLVFEQPFELAEIVKYRGKTITVNFLASTGANWSPTSGKLSVSIFCGTGAVRARGGSGYTGETAPLNTFDNIAAGSAAAAYSHTSASVIPTNTTQMTLYFFWTPVGTAGADDWFQIDDVMWSVGTAAQPFDRRPFEAEYALCRRYYEKSFNYAIAPAQNVGVGTGEQDFIVGKAGAVSGAVRIPIKYKTPKQAAGTITLFNPAAANGQIRNETTNADLTSASVSRSDENGIMITATGDAGGAVGDLLSIHWTASAEL